LARPVPVTYALALSACLSHHGLVGARADPSAGAGAWADVEGVGVASGAGLGTASSGAVRLKLRGAFASRCQRVAQRHQATALLCAAFLLRRCVVGGCCWCCWCWCCWWWCCCFWVGGAGASRPAGRRPGLDLGHPRRGLAARRRALPLAPRLRAAARPARRRARPRPDAQAPRAALPSQRRQRRQRRRQRCRDRGCERKPRQRRRV
jgi:hypothetical protein